jgi:D-glycero-D-manno-heptose 1,7-bisphosphate phosphatase
MTLRQGSGRAPAVFLDRDGTMIEDVGYLDSLSRVAFYPWTVDAIRMLNRAGLPVVVVTNQAGIARGFFSEAFVQETHRLIAARLEAGGARVDAYYYCPHHIDGRVAAYARSCGCRKPGRGMIDQAVGDLGLDPGRSFVVGDTWLDIGLARAAGARGILVRTGAGAAWEARRSANLTADAVVDNLAAAASWIIRSLTSETSSEIQNSI